MWIKIADSLINLDTVNYISFKRGSNKLSADVAFQNGEILEFSNPDPMELLKLFKGIKYEDPAKESPDEG
jgi:hypothetical protein